MTYRLAISLLLLPTFAAAQQPVPKTPPGFQVEIVLQSPDIEAPTALCVASNGDVYYAEDPMDMRGPPTKNIDKIWMLKGGDPKKKILIADQMWAVMGLEIVRDKLYVVHAPYVTVFTLDADGKPKERKDLFTDLGPKVAGLPGFNDHIPSGIRMGMDGWLYVSIGDKGIPKMTRKEPGSVEVAEGRWRLQQGGQPHQPRRRRRHPLPPRRLRFGGLRQRHPQPSRCATGRARPHLRPRQHRRRPRLVDPPDVPAARRLHGLSVGVHAPSEGSPADDPRFRRRLPVRRLRLLRRRPPETYRGRIFHCEWGKGMVSAVKVAPDGGGFKFVDEIKFLDPAGTKYKDFRPFSLRPTADGRGFYVTDWGFSGWSSKVKAGRLLKVTYTKDDVKPAPRGKDTDKIEDLIKALDHPAHSERLRAQRALIAKGNEAVALLEKCEKQNGLTPTGLRHAFWVLRETNSPGWTEAAMRHAGDKDPRARLEAVRVLGTFPERANKSEIARKILAKVRPMVPGPVSNPDPNAFVRAAAAKAIGELYSTGSSLAQIGALEKETDPFVRFALIRSAVRTGDWRQTAQIAVGESFFNWEDSLIEGYCQVLTEQFNVPAVRILAQLAKHPSPKARTLAVVALARAYHDRKPYAGGWWGTQPAGQKPPARNVSWEGTAAVREALLKALADKDAGVRKAAVLGLIEANDPATFEPLVQQYGKETDAQSRADLVRAIAGLSSPKTADFLKGILLDAKNPEPIRVEAIAGLEKSKNASAAEAIAKAAAGTESEALQVRALEALGVLKAKQLQTVGTAAVKSPSAKVRQTAVAALAKLGDPGTATAILPLLNDKEATVRTAAIQALGALKAKIAIPALIKAANDSAMQFDAIKALAQMPDVRALTAYLTGLGSKSPELRTACRLAVGAIREPAVPVLEQLVKRNEVRPEVIAELRTIYSSYSPILDWRIVGPFPNDGKPHPPEKEQKFDAVYKGADGKEVKWRAMKGDANNHGKIDLTRLPGPHQEVVAYGYAEIESAGRARRRVPGRQRRFHHHLAQRQEGPSAPHRPRLVVQLGQGQGPLAKRQEQAADPVRPARRRLGIQRRRLRRGRSLCLPQGRRPEVQPGRLPHTSPARTRVMRNAEPSCSWTSRAWPASSVTPSAARAVKSARTWPASP